MKFVKNNSSDINNYYIEDNNNRLVINVLGNEDLYWSMYSNNKDVSSDTLSMTITRENYGLYLLFERLFWDIKNVNIYEDKSFNEHYYQNMMDRQMYKSLYNDEEKIITWYSDETSNQASNILRIKQNEDEFILEFSIQHNPNSYEKDFGTSYYIPIRFRNARSRYTPFNEVFMRMYDDLDKIDDINDINHQMHIEEYLYKLKK